MPETADRPRPPRASPRLIAWPATPAVKRALVVSVVFIACFFWTTAVAGLSIAMAERGADHWWLVLVFGLLMLVITLAGTFGALAFFGRAAPARPAPEGAGVSAPRPGRAARTDLPIEPLSPREREVLEQLAAGRSNSEIAKRLYVAPGTVKAHLNHIFRKLEAASRLQAVAHAREAGLLDAPEHK